MNPNTLVFALAVLIPSSAMNLVTAQVDRGHVLPAPTVKDAGIYHVATQTWTRFQSPIAMLGTDVLYDNSCLVGWYFQGLTDGESIVDAGRLPSATSPSDSTSLTGTGDALSPYSVHGFSLSYCTSEPVVDLQVSFYECYDACMDATLLAPTQTVDMIGFPGVGTGSVACWIVTVDLHGTTQEFNMLADCDGFYDATPSIDNFGWSFTQTTFDTTGQGSGMMMAGDPFGITTGSMCPYGDGTIWSGNSASGTGIGSGDIFETDVNGAFGGCWFFGGYSEKSPYASFYFQISGDSGAVVAPNDSCLTPSAISGQGTFSYDTLQATTGAEGQVEANCGKFGATGISSDIWYLWTADVTGTASVSFCQGGGGDPKVAVWPDAGCPTDFTSLVCNDDTCGLLPEVQFAVQAGSRYLLQVGTYPGGEPSVGSFDISIEPIINYDRQLLGAWLEDTTGSGLVDTVQLQMGFKVDGAPAAGLDLSFDVGVFLNGAPFWQGQGADIYVATPNPDGSCDQGCPSAIPCGQSIWNSNLPWTMVCTDSICTDGLGDRVWCCACIGYYQTGTIAGTGGSVDGISMGDWMPNVGDSIEVRILPSAGSAPEATLENDNLVLNVLGEHYCTAELNSSGLAAIIQPGGSSSVSAGDFTLSASRIPRDQPGLFFFGNNAIEVPFGNGVRCVGGQVHRLPAAQSDVGLMQASVFGAPTAGVLTPGSTWNFQAWYRDPVAGGSGFNLSNGYRVTFTP